MTVAKFIDELRSIFDDCMNTQIYFYGVNYNNKTVSKMELVDLTNNGSGEPVSIGFEIVSTEEMI